MSGAVIMASQLLWTEDEVVLLIGFLRETGGEVPSIRDERLVALSNYLKGLPIYPEHGRDTGFRSPSSVRMKCFNLLANDPTLYTAKNLVATNADIWTRYWGDDEVTPSPNLDPGLVRESSCPYWGLKGFSDEEATQCRADRGLASAG
jgi:hypothetical protein